MRYPCAFIKALLRNLQANVSVRAPERNNDADVRHALMKSSIGTPPDQVVKTYAFSFAKSWRIFDHSQASRWTGKPSINSRIFHLSKARSLGPFKEMDIVSDGKGGWK